MNNFKKLVEFLNETKLIKIKVIPNKNLKQWEDEIKASLLISTSMSINKNNVYSLGVLGDYTIHEIKKISKKLGIKIKIDE